MLFANYLAGPLSHWSLMNAGVVDLDYFRKIAGERGIAVEQLIDEMLDARRRARRKQHNDADPLLLKTHAQLREDHPFLSRTDRAIYLVRDPRDVLLSHLNYRRLTFRDDVDGFRYDREYAMAFIERGGDPPVVDRYGTWASNVRSWVSPSPQLSGEAPSTLLVRYEDVCRDPARHLSKMLEFLNYPVDDVKVNEAIARSDRKEMRRLEAEARETQTFFRAREGHWFVGEGGGSVSLTSLGEDVEQRFVETFGSAMEQFGYAACRVTAIDGSQPAADEVAAQTMVPPPTMSNTAVGSQGP